MWLSGGPRLTLGVRDANSDELLGMVEGNTDWTALALQASEVNISYQVYPSARGRGVATHVVALLMKYLGATPTLATAAIQTVPDNVALARTASGLGFTRERDRLGQHGMDLYTKPLR